MTTTEERKRLEDWRALRIAALSSQFMSELITQEQFLHDVRQALQGDK